MRLSVSFGRNESASALPLCNARPLFGRRPAMQILAASREVLCAMVVATVSG